MFGFLNVYKPVGMTSHDVISYFRKILKIKQIGHTGTLDPFAEGVLPICIGKSTKLIEYLDDDKAYLAYVQFGKATDTFDVEGNIISESSKKVTRDEIESGLNNFKGNIEQIPPIYSAIKFKGKKLYEYAREGKEIKIEPRKVFISKICLKEFNFDNQTAQIYIECSKGTYIRSIANDLGKLLNSGAYLYKLIRTQAGKFFVENSIKMDEFKSQEDVTKFLINPLDMLNMETYSLSDEELDKIVHGQPILNKSIKSGDFIILVYNKIVKAVATIDGDFIKVNKVFNND